MKKIILFTIILIFGFLIFEFQGVKAGASDNVSGYAWSENIGWISFNCTNQDSCGTVDYGVNIDSSTGNFSGYAWSENIGWISFNASDLAGCPSGTCEASVNLDTGEASGWARALAYGGGWDGWIKLRGTNYGVSINPDTGEFAGFAWSDMVIGWISFNYGVFTTPDLFNQPPSAVNLSSSQGDYCAAPYPPIYLSWEFSDPDSGDSQSAYQIQVDNNSNFSSPEKDSGKVISSSNSYAPISLSYATTYYWRVKVWDSQDTDSSWAIGPSFATALHAYPDPDFTWSPEEPSQEEVVIFDSDPTETYGGTIVSSYFWTITEGEGEYVDDTDNSSQYPHIKFSTQTNKVKLKVTDSDGYWCECGEKTITAQLPLPEWKEIPPVLWLKNFLASLWKVFDIF